MQAASNWTSAAFIAATVPLTSSGSCWASSDRRSIAPMLEKRLAQALASAAPLAAATRVIAA